MSPVDGPDAAPHDEDGYDGAVEVTADGRTVAATASLRGHFDPVSGRYRWYGRLAADPQVAELTASVARAVRLRTPHAEVATTLSDVDPWGRPRVDGFGAPPFPVPTVVVDDVG